MPEKGTMYDILGGDAPQTSPSGGKAAGMDPMLQQQDATNVTAGAGKDQTGIDPDLRTRQNTDTAPIPPANIPPAKAQVQNPSSQLAGKPEQPKQLSYAEMIERLSPYKMPTPEEVEAQRKREKQEMMWSAIGDGLAAIANLVYAPQSGISNYDPKNSMSAKARERWDRLNKQREEQSRAYLNLWMQAKGHDDAAAQWQAQFDYRKQKDADDAKRAADQWQQQFEYRKERDAAEDQRRKDEFEWKKGEAEKARQDADKKFNEQVRQFNRTYSLNSAKVRADQQKNMHTFFIGDETISIPKDALNSETISSVFNALPDGVRSAAQEQLGEPVYDSRKRNVVGYKPLTSDQMLVAIGAAINDSPDAQYRMRILAGQKPAKPQQRNEQPAAGDAPWLNPSDSTKTTPTTAPWVK